VPHLLSGGKHEKPMGELSLNIMLGILSYNDELSNIRPVLVKLQTLKTKKILRTSRKTIKLLN
jgi:hypothetical protein